ncbi:MAG: hypothetical protein IPL26_07200 [Leptospiraceae bacterium]|nr:hypothetical protein [Leptospiraceae bacterium]
MIRWILLIIIFAFFINCEEENSIKAKNDYLSVSYALSKKNLENNSTNIADHNKLEVQISLYRKIHNDALALYKGKKYLDSVGKFEEALDIHIEPETYYHYGKSLMSIGKFSEAIKAYELADILEYENKINLYYNIACAYSLSNEPEFAIKYLYLSILKGFKFFSILDQDSNLTYIRKNPKWKQILLHITSDKLSTKNPKEFLTNQTKKIKLKSNSKTYIYGSNGEDSDNIEIELFDGMAFYREETVEKEGHTVIKLMVGTYKIQKDSLVIELKKGKQETNNSNDLSSNGVKLSMLQPVSFELIYKDNLNGFMKNDFVIYGDDEVYALDKKNCAYIKDEEKINQCDDCIKQYEQKGYFCAY